MQSIKNSVRIALSVSSGVFVLSLPQAAYAVPNVAGTSHAVYGSCYGDTCILMNSTGSGSNHGMFVNDGECYAPFGSGGEFVELDGVMLATNISTLTFKTSDKSLLCGTASTWHIFRTTATTPNTYWAVKLDGSANLPTSLDSTNLIECDPNGTFNTATGCTAVPPALTAAPISTTQIDLAWTYNNNDTVFKIFKDGVLLHTTVAGATSYSATGLTCNTAYTFTIKTTNVNGDSTAAATTPATTTTSACPIVNAPIDLNFSKTPETFASEIELK